MDPVLALGLAGAAAASSAAPGPCILLACCRSATDGLLSGLRVTLGIAASKILLLACSWGVILGMVGVGEAAQNAFRLGGIALLAGVAVTMLAAQPVPLTGALAVGKWRLGDGALGLAVGLSSPLNLLFILALLPQFVDLAQLELGMAVLASAAVLLGGILPLLAACMFSAQLLAARPEIMRHALRLCGGAILGFAAFAMVAGP
jgi:threonine/homoserine/homoserine lactone efflux protein